VKDLDLDKPNEHIDYQLVPSFEGETQTWDVKILRSPFDGTVIRCENIALDGETQELKFNFQVVETLDESVSNTDNVELQTFAGDVLQDILVAAINDGTLKTKENDGNQSTADDSTESTD
jgi:ubiquinone biosynthesis protein UbiJ